MRVVSHMGLGTHLCPRVATLGLSAEQVPCRGFRRVKMGLGVCAGLQSLPSDIVAKILNWCTRRVCYDLHDRAEPCVSGLCGSAAPGPLLHAPLC
jgi:hypothetical protein